MCIAPVNGVYNKYFAIATPSRNVCKTDISICGYKSKQIQKMGTFSLLTDNIQHEFYFLVTSTLNF